MKMFKRFLAWLFRKPVLLVPTRITKEPVEFISRSAPEFQIEGSPTMNWQTAYKIAKKNPVKLRMVSEDEWIDLKDKIAQDLNIPHIKRDKKCL